MKGPHTTNTTDNKSTETQLILDIYTSKKSYNILFAWLFKFEMRILKPQRLWAEHATAERKVPCSSLGHSLLNRVKMFQLVRVVHGSLKEIKTLWCKTGFRKWNKDNNCPIVTSILTRMKNLNLEEKDKQKTEK